MSQAKPRAWIGRRPALSQADVLRVQEIGKLRRAIPTNAQLARELKCSPASIQRALYDPPKRYIQGDTTE